MPVKKVAAGSKKTTKKESEDRVGEPTCANCKYFRVEITESFGEVEECYRFPPNMISHEEHGYIVVNTETWKERPACGEFKCSQ
ncbi:hypothetical protein UFOVP671_41 [uncultured Caudovirales phage]|uniref:Uncharacterized protein n=1 Tax=uncultured Caudovirales phage TaxID=2100421 RepID=A0A6J5NF33_9CAUD|nr:hypothetical protein UFOVP671_41 [uncultured Caudovirales phage]